MNIEERIRKSLNGIKRDEKGWRTALDGAEESHSRELAQKNLRRLEAHRQTLLNQLVSNERRRQEVMRVAITDGIYTDHNSDGVCQQLVGEDWLEHAAPIPPRRGMSHAPVYLPTEKAVLGWNVDVVE